MSKEMTKMEASDVEKLMQEISNLNAQNSMLKNKLTQAMQTLEAISTDSFFKKLEWFWRIITTIDSTETFGKEFYDYCVNEFKELVMPKENTEKEKDSE